LAGTLPRTPLGNLQRSLNSIAGLRGPTIKERRRGKEGNEDGKGREKELQVMGGPPYANSWIRP